MIEPKPEYNIGDKAVTHRQAANAIFNKLNLAGMLSSQYGHKQLAEVICEALLLADAIVKEPSAEDVKFMEGVRKWEDAEAVKKIGDQMAGLTKQQAEELRRYLVEKYEVLPGCVEGLVWHKHGLTQGRWVKREAQSEFYKEFCRQFIVFAAPGG